LVKEQIDSCLDLESVSGKSVSGRYVILCHDRASVIHVVPTWAAGNGCSYKACAQSAPLYGRANGQLVYLPSTCCQTVRFEHGHESNNPIADLCDPRHRFPRAVKRGDVGRRIGAVVKGLLVHLNDARGVSDGTAEKPNVHICSLDL
jgi:hypothetical protein